MPKTAWGPRQGRDGGRRMTTGGGGARRKSLFLKPKGKRAPPLRSFAADAHDCIMVWILWIRRIQVCGAMIRACWRASLRSSVDSMSLSTGHAEGGAERRNSMLDFRRPIQVRGSGPNQAHAREAFVAKLVVLIPSLDRGAIPLLCPSPLLDSLAVVTAPTPPQPELDKPHLWPAAPRRCGPS